MLVISDVTTDTKIHVSAHVRLWIEYAGGAYDHLYLYRVLAKPYFLSVEKEEEFLHSTGNRACMDQLYKIIYN